MCFEIPDGFRTDGEASLPSLCSFHWKEERERYDQLTFEIPVMSRLSTCHGYFINRYTFTPRKSASEPPTLSLISSTKVLSSPDPSYIEQYSTRVNSSTLSGCSIMLYKAYNTENTRIDWHVLKTIDESIADANCPPGQLSSSIRSVPSEMSLSHYHKCKMDHLSGAIIYTCAGERWIKIAYPA